MKQLKGFFTILLIVLFLIPCYATETKEDSIKAPRAIEIEDILAWKNIGSTALSNNGEWFAYRVAPNKGDSEVIIRQTKGDKEYVFPAGEGWL